MPANKPMLFKSSEPAMVDAFFKNLTHPMVPVMHALRKLILAVNKEIGEEIKWNAPCFFYTGPMKSFDAKLYKRHFIVFNLFRETELRLIFPSGARVQDTAGLLTGTYADGRRLATFSSVGEVKEKAAAMKKIITQWISTLDK